MGRPRKEKNEFPDLDEDTQNEIAGKSRDQLKEFIAKVAMDNENLLKMRDEDKDLETAKENMKTASAMYREGAKRNRQRTRLAMRCLSDKGGDTQPTGEANKE